MTRPTDQLAKSTAAYTKAHETIRAHAAELQAQREKAWAAGATRSAEVDAEVAAGVIHAGAAPVTNTP